jgi:hypothetical protein
MQSAEYKTGEAARESIQRRCVGAQVTRMIGGVFCAVIAATLIGCGGGSLESTVSGTVTLDGSGIGPGMIVFAPVAGGKPATGSIESDGGYMLKTSRETGLAPGKYQVAVSIREMPQNVKRGDRPPLGKLLIPEKYEQSTTSGLEYEVSSGDNSIDIALTSK